MESSQDRNLPASERKLQKARSEGQVARSTDLTHLAVLGAAAAAVLGLSPLLFERLKLALSQQLSFDAATVLQPGTMMGRLQDMVWTGMTGAIAFAAIIAVAVVLSAIAGGGWVASLKPVMPDFSRLSPLQGISGLFSKKKLAEIVKMTLVSIVLIAIAGMFLKSGAGTLASLVLQPSVSSLRHLMDWLTTGMGLLLVVILVVALIDLPLQNFLHKSQLKMLSLIHI